MDTANLGIMAGIVISLGFFVMVFGIIYLYKREKMAMIERGMDPRAYRAQPAPFSYLKWAFLLMGSGTGLFLAYLISHLAFKDEFHTAPVYFSLIAIFGGIGLFVSYLIEKKETIDKE